MYTWIETWFWNYNRKYGNHSSFPVSSPPKSRAAAGLKSFPICPKSALSRYKSQNTHPSSRRGLIHRRGRAGGKNSCSYSDKGNSGAEEQENENQNPEQHTPEKPHLKKQQLRGLKTFAWGKHICAKNLSLEQQLTHNENYWSESVFKQKSLM